MKVTSVNNVTNFYTTTNGEFATAAKNESGVWCRVVSRNADSINLGNPLTEEETKSIRSTVQLYFDTPIKSIPVDDNGDRSGDDIDTNHITMRVDVLHAQLRRNAELSNLLNKFDLQAILPGTEVTIEQTAVAKGEAIPNTNDTYSKDMYRNEITVVALSSAAQKLKMVAEKATVIEQLTKAFPGLPMDVVMTMIS